MRLVTLTMNPALDRSTQVEQVIPEKKLRCEAPDWQPGGGGINVARVIKRLGAEPLAIFPYGGAAGDMFIQLLEEEGIGSEAVSVNGRTRQSLAVREETSEQQFRFNFPGPKLSREEWQSVRRKLTDLSPAPDYLVLSGGLPPGVPDDFYAEVAADMPDTRIILDTSGAPLRTAVESDIFLVKPNLRELRQLMDADLADEEAQEAAAMELVEEAGCEVVVISLGAAGAMMATADGIQNLRAPTIHIRSKVGAGDSMVAGITWALAREWPIKDAVQFGIAAGAAAVTTPGTELCRADKTHELYEKIRHQDSQEQKNS